MKPNVPAIALAAILAALPLPVAIAQTQTPGAAAENAPAVPPDESRKPATRREARAFKAKADARLCLDFPTDLQVIMCAEKYR